MERKLPLGALGTLRRAELSDAQAGLRDADLEVAARRVRLEANRLLVDVATARRDAELGAGRDEFAARTRSAEELLAEAEWERESRRKEAQARALGQELTDEVRAGEDHAAAERARAGQAQARVDAVAAREGQGRVAERRRAEQVEEERTEEGLRGAPVRK